jgi:hypothetical protein
VDNPCFLFKDGIRCKNMAAAYETVAGVQSEDGEFRQRA